MCVESEDALSGQIRKPGDVRDKSKMPYSNPIAGPIFVHGAQPGDSLAVRISDIRPTRVQCATYTGAPKQLCEWLGTDVPPGAHVCPIRDGFIHWSDKLKIPYAPMLGCIGTAPEVERAQHVARRHLRRQHGSDRDVPRKHPVSAGLR